MEMTCQLQNIWSLLRKAIGKSIDNSASLKLLKSIIKIFLTKQKIILKDHSNSQQHIIFLNYVLPEDII